MNHRAPDPAFAACRVCLAVLAEPAIAAEPGEGAFDDPSLGEHDEPTLPLEFGHDLEPEAEVVCGPVLQLALLAGIGPDGLPSGVAIPVKLDENPFGCITVLYVCGRNRQSVDQPEGVDGDGALSAPHLLAGLVASGPPFSVVFTDWLSSTAALGVASRPATWRTSCTETPTFTRSAPPYPSGPPSLRQDE